MAQHESNSGNAGLDGNILPPIGKDADGLTSREGAAVDHPAMAHLGNPRYLVSDSTGLLGVLPADDCDVFALDELSKRAADLRDFIDMFWEYIGLVTVALIKTQLSTVPGVHQHPIADDVSNLPLRGF